MSDAKKNSSAGREPAEKNGSGQEPKRAGGTPPKDRLVDPAVVGAHEAERRAKQLLDNVKEEREARVVTLDPSTSRLRELLKRQASLPRVTEEEADRKSHDPNAFPPEVRQLIDQKRYRFLWVTNPYTPGRSQSDRQIAAQHLRAMGAGGVYEIATRTALGDELPDYLFDGEGVISRSDQILAYVEWSVWERRREAERASADQKLKAAEEGRDEQGQIPGVHPTHIPDMGLQSDPIPDQPGLGPDEGGNTPNWEGGFA